MSTPFRLLIPPDIHDAMLRHAQLELPNECCGLLAGIVTDGIGKVSKGYPLANSAASPTEYLSDPLSMFQAVRDMRTLGTEVLAVYHSHPTSAPIPSRRDLERNYSIHVVNLIVSLKDAVPEVRGWWLDDAGYRPAEWEIGT